MTVRGAAGHLVYAQRLVTGHTDQLPDILRKFNNRLSRAFRITGTISPSGTATATPRFISSMILKLVPDEMSIGKGESSRALTVAASTRS